MMFLQSKGNIINNFLFLWYNWHLFLQSKGNRKNKLLLISYDIYSLQQTIRMSIKHLAAEVKDEVVALQRVHKVGVSPIQGPTPFAASGDDDESL
ncbi:unnamed protein product [Heligmosomoides polygyrus]|uniref:Uncharacterized protein n=1 Tax=Heligmosomoides polygyrus TaxID=6339 RepID=A0A183F339_HELPZ|nr:unnamed protein product [Heligmosomoides polygyrus]